MDEVTRIVVRDRVDFFNPRRIEGCPTMQRLMDKLVAHGWAYDLSQRYVDGALTLTAL